MALRSRTQRSFLLHLELQREKVADWGAFPFNIPAIAQLGRLDLSAPVTFFVGENGSGKSTLIEAIAMRAGFGAAGGTKNFNVSHRVSESCLHEFLRIARGPRRESAGFFLRAETMFNVSTEAEQYASYGWANLHEMSHGEAFLWVAMHKFPNGGLFILDEPEAALSPQRQLALMLRIRQLIHTGSQFIISTHSPILLAYPEAIIYALDREGIHRTRYEDTEHYAVTRAFLQDPAARLRVLFAEADQEPDV
jgi:predicted ATPase